MQTEILNFTGQRIGIANGSGTPIKTLPKDGNARLENFSLRLIKTIDQVPVYEKYLGKVRGLPAADPNLSKMYIVSRDVADAVGHRADLLVPEDPFQWEGATFYKRLVNI